MQLTPAVDQLFRRVLREELQGTLGQRFTGLGNRLLRDFERAIAERLVVIEPGLVSPHDHDAERAVPGAILDKQVTLEDLAPLASKHFLTPWIAAAIDALQDPSCGVSGVQSHLVELGYPSSAVEELHAVADFSPIVAPEVIRQRAAQLIELWRRRVIGAACERARAGMFAGLLTSDEAIALVRAAVVETKQ